MALKVTKNTDYKLRENIVTYITNKSKYQRYISSNY